MMLLYIIIGLLFVYSIVITIYFNKELSDSNRALVGHIDQKVKEVREECFKEILREKNDLLTKHINPMDREINSIEQAFKIYNNGFDIRNPIRTASTEKY